MRRPALLWVDFCGQSADAGLSADLAAMGRVYRCDHADDIPAIILNIQPDVLCFDFDYPDAHGLKALKATKSQFASLPILMFCRENTMELAVWALRARVWDLFVKPVGAGMVCTRLGMLSRIVEQQRNRRARNVYMPAMKIPDETGLVRDTKNTISMQTVVDYLTRHMDEKVSLAAVSRLCGMGSYEFSRAFRREQGVTFRGFMMQMRISRAVTLLKESSANVLEVACAVGFNDPSQFARVFRRYVGVTPSAYRNRNRLSRRTDSMMITHGNHVTLSNGPA